MDEGLKSPYWPNVEEGELIAEVLGAIAEVLGPGDVRTELRRGPVVGRHESSNSSSRYKELIQFFL